jgi:general secretion pathway protein K
MDPSIFYGTDEREGLRNYSTVFSEGKININTASLPVLMSLSPKVDQAMAEAVLDHRREKPFRGTEDLRSIPGWESVYPQISSEITVRSHYFSLEVQGIYRDARAPVQAVIKREGNRSRILFWKAG